MVESRAVPTSSYLVRKAGFVTPGIAVVLLASLVGHAQQTTKPKASKASTEEQTETKELPDEGRPDEPIQDSSSQTTAPEPADDLGEPPPAVPARDRARDEKKRQSPLTPRPDEFPKRKAVPPAPEYDVLLSDIAALRSRVAALTTTLFKSKLRIVVETDGEEARITSFAVTLDDGIVYSAPARFFAEDEKIVYEHAVAPGHHVVGVEIEREDARGKQYKNWQIARFSVVVPDSQLLETHMLVEDDSNMAEDFPEDSDGEYDLRVRLRARVAEP